MRRNPGTLCIDKEVLYFLLHAWKLVDLHGFLVEKDLDLPNPLLHERIGQDDEMGAIWYLYLIFLIFLSAGLVHRILIKEDVEDIFITTDPSRAGNGHKLDSHPPIIGTPIVDGDVKVVPRF